MAKINKIEQIAKENICIGLIFSDNTLHQSNHYIQLLVFRKSSTPTELWE